ncbi:MAG: TIM barrel protein [Planctomycetota bacterium]
MQRRHFFKASGAGVGAAIALRSTGGSAALPPAAEPPICVFTKHVQRLSFDELAKRLQSIGVQGVEATLRKGGQIAPQALRDQLPRYVDALSKYQQSILIAASDVNEAGDETERYLKELAKAQVPFFRMKYYRYNFEKPILPQLDQFASDATKLADLCREIGITALYQNHAGRNYCGAALWDLEKVLSEVDPDALGVAVDIRHTSLELSQSYEAGFRMIKPRMRATYVKDFDWFEGKAQNVPLGEGRSKPLFELIQKTGFVGPLSLHMEYTDHRDASTTEASWDAIAKDAATLKGWLGEN